MINFVGGAEYGLEEKFVTKTVPSSGEIEILHPCVNRPKTHELEEALETVSHGQ